MMNPESVKELNAVLKVSRNPLLPSEASFEILNAVQVSLTEGDNSISAAIIGIKNLAKNNIKILSQEDSSSCNVTEGNIPDFQGNIETDDGGEILSMIESNENLVLKLPAKQQQMNGMSNEMKRIVLSICCQKWLVETQPSKILLDYELLKEDENYSLVKTFEEYWNKVAKAHELGNDSLALYWIQVAKDIQQALEDSIKKVQASKNEENASRDTEYPWTNITCLSG